jgi:DNA-binding GntR family transcriptional regulator
VDEVKDLTPDAVPAPAADDGRLTRTGPRGQQVVEALRNEIIAGHFEPGQRLIEATLSQELGTSRGPVREALRQLENEGLVMSVPYKGAVVLGVSDEEVQEVLIPIRLVLERYSFAHAIRVMTDADFAELGKQIWVMERAARDNDLLKVVEADLRFHDIVISSAGQTHTTQIWRSIWPRIRAYFFRYGLVADLAQIAVEHGQLVEAMQTRDRDLVLEVVERHITVRTPGR